MVQKVFKRVKLSFVALISILVPLLQAAVHRSAGKPLATRSVVEPDNHQLPEQRFSAGLGLKGCQEQTPRLHDEAKLRLNQHLPALCNQSKPQPPRNMVPHEAGDRTLHYFWPSS